MAAATRLDEDQIRMLVVLERAGGSISLFSVLLIFICYGMFPRLRTVHNTFVVFGSVANIGAAIGCIIAYDGIHQGLTSPLCQFQGFLLQMFVQSDPWWALATAVNVLLVFVRGANPRAIRKWGWIYCLVCYGGPFGLALACLLVNAPGKSSVYGDAGTWCWISNEWSAMRIYMCYMLVWGCILTSLVIYAGVGVHVFRTRTRVQYASEEGRHIGETDDHKTLSDNATDRRSAISISDWPLTPTADRILNSAMAHLFSTSPPSHTRQDSASPSPFLESSVTRPDRAHSPHRSPNQSFETSYSRRTATSAGLTPFLISTTPPRSPSPSPSVGIFSHRLADDDPVKRTYLRTAVFFTISTIVTWAPTSAHLVHELVHGDAPFAYHAATAATLPLQGLWSCIIFFATSWDTVQECLAAVRARPRRRRREEKRSGGSIKSKSKPKPKGISPRGNRHGRSVYSMWQDAEPAGNGGVGLGIHVSWRKDTTPSRRDSWDFLDIGVDESQMTGLRNSTQTTATNSERTGTAQSGKIPPPLPSPKIIVDCPGGMI